VRAISFAMAGVHLDDDLKQQLRKLGLRVRPRTVEKAATQNKPGHITFDERGNAVYEWNDALAQDSEEGERARNKALQYHGLTLVEDDPSPNAPIQVNEKGVRLGYNPYESGLLPKKPRAKKRDLRELSKWVDMKRRLQKKTDE
jgi:hypothetical protein